METLAPYVIGLLATVVALAYRRMSRSKGFSHGTAYGLSAALLFLWVFSMVVWLGFHQKIDYPWVYLPMIPAHIMLAWSAFTHVGRIKQRWLWAFFTVAGLMVVTDAWFWWTWWPMRNQPYNSVSFRLFELYGNVRSAALLLEVVIVAWPGGGDGVRTISAGRHRLHHGSIFRSRLV